MAYDMNPVLMQTGSILTLKLFKNIIRSSSMEFEGKKEKKCAQTRKKGDSKLLVICRIYEFYGQLTSV